MKPIYLAPLACAAMLLSFTNAYSHDVGKADTQRGFVDDPQKAVRAGDELVAQVIRSLSDSFSEQRAELEGDTNQTEKSSTENRRLAFQRYRSFFERLLSI